MMIAQIDPFAGSINSQFAYLIAILVLLVAVYFAFFKPAGNFVLGYTTIILGSISFSQDLSFVKIVAIIQFLGTAFVAIRYLIQKNNPIKTDFLRKNRIVLSLIVLLWVKIMVDCLTTGMDIFKSSGLKLLLVNIIAPLSLLIFAKELNGSKKAAKDIITGMLVYATILLIASLPSVIIEGGIRNSFSDQDVSADQTRFSSLGADPINYGRFFFIGFCGCILMALTFTHRAVKYCLYGLSFCFFVFIVATGTRQFLLSSMFFMFFFFNMLKMRKVLYASVFGLAMFVSTLSFMENISSYVGNSGSVLDRFSINRFTEELAEDRGAIWRQAYAETLNHFSLGVGFRSFSEPYATINAETREEVYILDSAHGFFQDLFVEHGIFLGTAFLALYIRSLVSIFRKKKANKLYYGNFLQIIGLSLSVAEFFTGAVFMSIGVYVAIVFANCDDEEVVADNEVKVVTHPRLAEIVALKRAT